MVETKNALLIGNYQFTPLSPDNDSENFDIKRDGVLYGWCGLRNGNFNVSVADKNGRMHTAIEIGVLFDKLNSDKHRSLLDIAMAFIHGYRVGLNTKSQDEPI